MQTNVLQGMRAMLQRLHQQRRETQMTALMLLEIVIITGCLALMACLACACRSFSKGA
jgi:CHASE3 domain sensor protein